MIFGIIIHQENIEQCYKRRFSIIKFYYIPTFSGTVKDELPVVMVYGTIGTDAFTKVSYLV